MIYLSTSSYSMDVEIVSYQGSSGKMATIFVVFDLSCTILQHIKSTPCLLLLHQSNKTPTRWSGCWWECVWCSVSMCIYQVSPKKTTLLSLFAHILPSSLPCFSWQSCRAEQFGTPPRSWGAGCGILWSTFWHTFVPQDSGFIGWLHHTLHIWGPRHPPKKDWRSDHGPSFPVNEESARTK